MSNRLVNLKRILIITAASVIMALSCINPAAADVTNSYTLTYDSLGVASGNVLFSYKDRPTDGLSEMLEWIVRVHLISS